MNILYISPNGYLGGAEKFLLDLNTQHLKNESVKAETLFLNDGEIIKKFQKVGIKHSLLPFRMRLSNLLSLYKTIFFVRRKIVENKCDIVHCTMPYGFIIGSLASLFIKQSKVVWFQHGPVGGLLDKISMFLPVDLILFNSDFTLNVHNKLFGSFISKKKQGILKLGIKKNKSEFISKSDFLEEKESYLFLTAGRICSWKGYETLISAMNLLRDTHSDLFDKTKVLIAGSAKRKSDIIYFEKLKKIVVDLKLESKVVFLGHVDNLEKYMVISDVFIHCSKEAEPFGLVVGEAMINKCFILGSTDGGVSDILKHNITGYAYDTNSANSSEFLLKLIYNFYELNTEEKNKIINTAFENILLNYSVEKMEKDCCQYYKEINKS